MKVNSTIVLTLFLLLLMAGAGVASGFWGFTLGHKALKGVSQPDVSPSKKLTQNTTPPEGEQELRMLLDEQELIKHAEAVMSGKVEPQKPTETTTQSANGDASVATESQTTTDTQLISLSDSLPIRDQQRGVTMEITQASQEGDALLLTVNLKNEGRQMVRFLYSFLEVKDEQGRALSAITDGLPGELPANGQSFSGTVKIPTALLTDSKELSLLLTDYPDRTLELNLADIPIR
ncbi:hypothetical protein [Spirulina subsalsa]|uniref:hypothetical protein n=1 Tax=Spirulina subsalsa TaxID=54311 RepID=UPI000306BF3B|nr:hypothetical protein [Spirulina subsalsa]